ncbi:C40 family peptidase [Brevifollis gellanilyticus]|nr:NlpC/P60 family protein [Brevifollis gellanilyticus]
MSETDLVDFERQPEGVKRLIRDALALTRRKLTYIFGSSNPARGGMDCSGTIYYLLGQGGVRFNELPRQSDEMCAWVQAKSRFYRTRTATSLSHPEFANLQPGDLVFWSGTYSAGRRVLPVTHVMIYLGRSRSTGKPVVFGASDGRRYEGQKRTGVSLFDFVMPKPGAKAAIYGYGRIPGLVAASSRPSSSRGGFFNRLFGGG